MLPYHFHIIANPIAGTHHGKRNTKKVLAYLNDQHLDFDLQQTHYPGHATTLAQNITASAYDSHQHIVLVIGGDGTLHQVVKGLLRNRNVSYQLPIGYIPSGSGNDFSRSLKLPKDPLANLKRILNATDSQALDVGILESQSGDKSIFINNIGIGVDARTVFLTNHSKIKIFLNRLKLGTFAYGANLLKAFWQQTSFNAVVTQNGQLTQVPNVFLVTFGNEPFFGGGVPILPNANVHSHQIDLILVEKMPVPQLLLLFYRVFKNGTHLTDPKVHYFQGTDFKLETDGTEYGQVDGEELGHQAYAMHISLSQYPFWFK